MRTRPLTERAFRAALEAPPRLDSRCALYLDFDGTLVDLAPTPKDVIVHSHLTGLLERLSSFLGGAVAIVTGRWLADVDGLLSPMVLPGAGLHGAELRQHEMATVTVRTVPGIGELVAHLRERFADDPRILVEDKGAAVSLHYRLAPERATECIQALRAAVAGQPALETLAGNMVVEARLRGTHKGIALQQLSEEPAFAGRMPVFVGDDVSDEDAFAVARDLGGYGVKVGDAGAPDTCATYRWPSVAHVHAWLESSLAAPRAVTHG